MLREGHDTMLIVPGHDIPQRVLSDDGYLAAAEIDPPTRFPILQILIYNLS
jgi:hypothetical protein